MIVNFEHHYIPLELAQRLGIKSDSINSSEPSAGKRVEGIAEYIDVLRQLPLEAKTIDGMLGGTAARLLKLT